MNIKSLLIGSAATAMVGVTGAQAADAIMIPEPEPMEYVRVCDVYGAGFFYIPGTETCLKLSGYVRYQISFDDDDLDLADFDDGGWQTNTEAELQIDARSETEYGTLRGYLVFRGATNPDPDVHAFPNEGGYLSSTNLGGYVRVQDAIIELGGLSMGVTDTLYDAGLFGEFDSGGGSRIHFVRYTFDMANGVTAALALEEADKDYDYTPNVVGKVGFAQGWGGVNLYGAYDATAEEFAVKAVAAVNISRGFSIEGLATYESGQNFYSVGNNVGFAVGGDSYERGYEWSAGAVLKAAATPKLTVGLGGQYFSDAHVIGGDDWSLGMQADYYLVPNFLTRLAVNYRDGDNFNDGVWDGYLRFQRDF